MINLVRDSITICISTKDETTGLPTTTIRELKEYASTISYEIYYNSDSYQWEIYAAKKVTPDEKEEIKNKVKEICKDLDITITDREYHLGDGIYYDLTHPTWVVATDNITK